MSKTDQAPALENDILVGKDRQTSQWTLHLGVRSATKIKPKRREACLGMGLGGLSQKVLSGCLRTIYIIFLCFVIFEIFCDCKTQTRIN